MPPPGAHQLCHTRRHAVGDHIGGAIPGYSGHVPGHRVETTTFGHTFAAGVDASRAARSRGTVDAQGLRAHVAEVEFRRTASVPTIRAPAFDNRGHGHPAAGDLRHSRAPLHGEEPAHRQSSLDLTSLAYEGLGGAPHLKGYAKAATGVPGYMGHVPGLHAENVFAQGWSKGHERSLSAHFDARGRAASRWCVATEGGTLVPAHAADRAKELPLRSRSYQDQVRGWSTCEFVGRDVDPAGRLAPRDRQESFGTIQANTNVMTPSAPIHGYAGWVPGRVGDNVVGERQCKTNAVSQQLFHKNRMRITQR